MRAVYAIRKNIRRPLLPRRKKLRMHRIVLRPRRLNRTRKGQHLFRIQRIIRRRSAGIPLPAMLDRPPRILAHVSSRVRRIRIPVNMLQLPQMKRHHPPIVIGRPPPVLWRTAVSAARPNQCIPQSSQPSMQFPTATIFAANPRDVSSTFFGSILRPRAIPISQSLNTSNKQVVGELAILSLTSNQEFDSPSIDSKVARHAAFKNENRRFRIYWRRRRPIRRLV